MSTKTLIEADQLTFVRSGETIVDHFTFKIGKGQFVGVIGPNGGGKTTLIKLIMGLFVPTSGRIRVFGEDPRSRSVRRRLAYVPQRGGNIDPLFPATVAELVRSGLAGKKIVGNPDEAVRLALDAVDIEALYGRPLARISGGERQRALIARALVSDPEMLVLDEPTDGLDPETRRDFFRLLKELKGKRGLTIIFVSHDVHAVTHEADAALCLKHEQICHDQHACHLSRDELRNVLHGREDLGSHHHHEH